MEIHTFPSALTRVVIKYDGIDHEIAIPKKELFRVKNIFIDHEYAIPNKLIPRKDMTIVDIGANIGLFALYMKLVKADSKVHCFEPVPSTLELLHLNVGKMEGVSIHPIALSDHNDTAPLLLNPMNTGQNSIKIHPDNPMGKIEVPLVDTFSALEHIGLIYIDVLKIDTEGCEVDILKSLSPRLANVGIVLVEYHFEQDRRQIDDILSQFKLFGAHAVTANVGTLKYINKRLIG